MELTLAQLAKCSDGHVVGDSSIRLNGITSLHKASVSELSLYVDKRYAPQLANTKAGAILTNKALATDCTGAKLIVDNPRLALAKIMNAFAIDTSHNIRAGKISESSWISHTASLGSDVHVGAQAVIGKRVVLGDGVSIGPCTVIGDDVNIGDHTKIDANVSIYHDCCLGKHCHISAGAVIGADGFGFASEYKDGRNRWIAIPQTAAVKIGDDVHIGANSAIDRGSLEDTLIDNGVIIDNLVQIGHNVIIGQDAAIAGCVAIAGSTQIGKNCQIGGRATIAGHLMICDETVIYADSLITKTITKAGVYSSSLPAMPLKQWHKMLARFRMLSKR